MQTIQNKAIQTYNDNMNYFQEKHENLYTKLKALETLLEDGRYPHKYDLEYKDGYFDVIELQSTQLLYNTDSNKFSSEILKAVNTKKDAHVFESFKDYHYRDEDIKLFKTLQASDLFATTAPIIHYYNTHHEKSQHMKEIHKFIFFGTGLGLHLPMLMKKYNFKMSLVIEDDIELFRLSLFTCQYSHIFKNKLVYFSIAQNEHEFQTTFTQFFEMSFSYNHYIKFFAFSNQYDKKIQNVQKLILTRPENSYQHELLLIKNKKVIHTLTQKYKFLNLLKKEEESFFDDKPVIILGAGPSLDKNIQWLKNNQNKFVIIAALASLKTILDADIKPDIVMQIDEKEAETTALLKRLKNKEFLKKVPCIFSASVPQVLLDACTKENIYLIEDRTYYKLRKSYLESASIGEAMYAVSLIFNAKNIYLLGLDFALAEDGTTHAKEHHGVKKIDEDETADTDAIDMDKSLLNIKGNLRATVQTTPRLSMSIPIFNQRTRDYKSTQQHVYNLNDGAYLESAEPLQTSKVKLETALNKNKLHTQLLSLFDHYATADFNAEETALLQERNIQIENFQQNIQDFKQTPGADAELFLKNYAAMMNSMLQQKHLELLQILTIYFLTLSSYVFDFFNTKELKNNKKHIKKLKTEIAEQLNKIIESYKDDLKKIV
ncbi:DUF115 domain-containing protein [Sulfurimonas sp. NW7]|uniref:motility associated factor glycosyltransferase family protein n=1 Tax=Sulfurimonas sp. NW7 TaxID=2922727 RepID=UPI003DA978EC